MLPECGVCVGRCKAFGRCVEGVRHRCIKLKDSGVETFAERCVFSSNVLMEQSQSYSFQGFKDRSLEGFRFRGSGFGTLGR